MANKKKTLAMLFISVLAIMGLCASAWFFLAYKLSRLEDYKDSIAERVSREFGHDIDFDTGKAVITLRRGLSIHFTNVALTEKDRSSDFLHVKSVFFRVRMLPLLRSHLVLSEIVLDEPRLSLQRDRSGVLNIADLLTEKENHVTTLIRKLTIENGSVAFQDQAASDEGIATALDNLQCVIDVSREENKARFTVTAALVEDDNQADLLVKGTFRPASSGNPMESTVEALIGINRSDIRHYHSYLKQFVPVEQLAGHINAEITFSGTLARFASKGSVTVKDASLSFPTAFRDVLNPRSVHVDCALTRNNGHLNLDIKHLAVDGFEANGQCDLREIDTEDPLLEAHAVTSIFSLKEFQSYVPWKIIPADVESFIETHVRDGNFRLVEGSLKGRLSEIPHMDEQGNAGVLFIQVEVDNGVFMAESSAPVFHDVGGLLKWENRQFSLEKMSGTFGNSPFTMEGSISDFALPHPVAYTAEMTIQPARDEILWLLGAEEFGALDFDGSSTLTLSGKGTNEEYHVSANWDLTDATYAYPDVFEKPGARENRLIAEIILHTDSIDVPSFAYDLPALRVSGSAASRSGGTSLSLAIQSEALDLREAAEILPVIRRFDPAGTCRLDLSGKGDLGDPASIQWEGTISLADASCALPAGFTRPITGVTGNIMFRGYELDTSPLTARIGESTIRGTLHMNDFRKPEFMCHVNSHLLRTADLGFTSPEGEVNLRTVRGQIALQQNTLHVYNLSFALGKSIFKLSGDMRHFDEPKITAELISPDSDFDDAACLLALEYTEKKDTGITGIPGMQLQATLRVDGGTFNGLDFKNLAAKVRYTPGTVDVETFGADFFEGRGTAKGKAHLHPDGRNLYEANISADGMSLEPIQRFLGIVDHTITGALFLTGEISATGNIAEDLKKTAAGTFQVRAEKGVLKKYSVLSKIFSLLNVLQLAKLQLPDMAKDGMPYKTITCSASLEKGIFSSEDFFIKSDAMEMSAVGNVDVLEKEIDAIVGVHPLQTLDLIASKIPIAGWVITDENGKLITVHVKVDGTFDDPTVTPITVQSIGRGVLNIFRRLFQLPGKLITDTGDVLLGH